MIRLDALEALRAMGRAGVPVRKSALARFERSVRKSAEAYLETVEDVRPAWTADGGLATLVFTIRLQRPGITAAELRADPLIDRFLKLIENHLAKHGAPKHGWDQVWAGSTNSCGIVEAHELLERRFWTIDEKRLDLFRSRIALLIERQAPDGRLGYYWRHHQQYSPELATATALLFLTATVGY